MNLEDIIRRGQDRLRGRPRDWRDDLHDWWQGFSFYDLFWRVYVTLAIIYFTGAFVGVPVWWLFFR